MILDPGSENSGFLCTLLHVKEDRVVLVVLVVLVHGELRYLGCLASGDW